MEYAVKFGSYDKEQGCTSLKVTFLYIEPIPYNKELNNKLYQFLKSIDNIKTYILEYKNHPEYNEPRRFTRNPYNSRYGINYMNFPISSLDFREKDIEDDFITFDYVIGNLFGFPLCNNVFGLLSYLTNEKLILNMENVQDEEICFKFKTKTVLGDKPINDNKTIFVNDLIDLSDDNSSNSNLINLDDSISNNSSNDSFSPEARAAINRQIAFDTKTKKLLKRLRRPRKL